MEVVHVDGAFRMGRTHLVCQDYVATAAGEFPCVLLADGCSSSPDTDTGARLLVRSALPHLPCLLDAASHVSASPSPRRFWENGFKEEGHFQQTLRDYHHQAICAARSHAEELRLSDTALDATLLTLIASGSCWCASVFGDGVVAALNRSGEMEVMVVSYPGGYPFYANYLTDGERCKSLLAQPDNQRQVETFWLEADGSMGDKHCLVCPADAPCACVTGSLTDYHWVALLSDGVHSFQAMEANCVNTPVPVEAVLPELLAFKTYGGQFVQRRMQKFQQQCALRGWQHHDDVAMGVISL